MDLCIIFLLVGLGVVAWYELEDIMKEDDKDEELRC